MNETIERGEGGGGKEEEEGWFVEREEEEEEDVEEVYVSQIICYMDPVPPQGDDSMFFCIGEVIEVDPHRACVIVNKFHCTTTCWREALSLDPAIHVRYRETCQQCWDPETFQHHTIPLENIVMAPINLEGPQLNELYPESRLQLAYCLGVTIIGGEELLRDNDTPPGLITLHRDIYYQSPFTHTCGRSEPGTTFRNPMRGWLSAACLHHMDENCPLRTLSF